VATLSKCTESLDPGQQQIGEVRRNGKMMKIEQEEPGYGTLAYSLAFDIVVRTLVLATFVASCVPCVWVAGAVWTILEPTIGAALALIPAVISFYGVMMVVVGVGFARLSQLCLHPGREGKVPNLSITGQLWMHYLQAIYLSQGYVLQAVNGGVCATLLHKAIGADTDINALWFSHAIRDHCILKAEANAVIDSGAYFVAHVGEPGGMMLFEKTTIKENACLHPYAILLAGQFLGNNSTLDSRAHCHFDKLITDNLFWTGSPAHGEPLSDCRVNQIRLDQDAATATA